MFFLVFEIEFVLVRFDVVVFICIICVDMLCWVRVKRVIWLELEVGMFIFF